MLLQDASVLGKSFTAEALAAISGQDARGARASAARPGHGRSSSSSTPIRGRRSAGSTRSPRALIREVAYATLAKADRRAQAPRGRAPPRVARRRGAGRRSSPPTTWRRSARTPEGPEADALAARARDWLAQAAQRALSLGSPEQALAYAEQALAITPEGAERANAPRKGGRASAETADPDRAMPTSRKRSRSSATWATRRPRRSRQRRSRDR